jgi:hypothetical protein
LQPVSSTFFDVPQVLALNHPASVYSSENEKLRKLKQKKEKRENR